MARKLSFILILSSSSFLVAGTAFAIATDAAKLPVGDGKLSTSPKAGYIYACQAAKGGGGAQADGPWIHGATWSSAEKISVQGAVSWPSAQFSAGTASGTVHSFSGNGLPVGSTTGVFPISSADPAYQYDRNPNSIQAQSVSYSLSAMPALASSPSCVPMGPIGIALNGVQIFNGLDGESRDAVAHEVQDSCGGHPERSGAYHYHGPSSCIPHQGENNALVGYALDGFGIYSGRDANGVEISTADLDECHGMTSMVPWDGLIVSMYHYVLTKDYPYTIGCFRGTPLASRGGTMAGMMPQGSGMAGSGSIMGGTSSQGFEISSESLSPGSRGRDVELLQAFLEDGGYLAFPRGVARGYFGAMTKNALKKYQKANGINPSGFFGPITKGHMRGMGSMGRGNSANILPMRTPSSSPSMGGGLGRPNGQPPSEAVASCSGKTANALCSFVSPMGDMVSGTCQSPMGGALACVPSFQY